MTSVVRDGACWRFCFPVDVLRKTVDRLADEWQAERGVCDTPALFVRGLRSRYITNNDEAVIKQVFPRARIASLDAGHWLHYERPAEFVSLASDFISEAC